MFVLHNYEHNFKVSNMVFRVIKNQIRAIAYNECYKLLYEFGEELEQYLISMDNKIENNRYKIENLHSRYVGLSKDIAQLYDKITTLEKRIKKLEDENNELKKTIKLLMRTTNNKDTLKVEHINNLTLEDNIPNMNELKENKANNEIIDKKKQIKDKIIQLIKKGKNSKKDLRQHIKVDANLLYECINELINEGVLKEYTIKNRKYLELVQNPNSS